MASKHFIYILRLLPKYRDEANHDSNFHEVVSNHFNHLKLKMDEGVVLLAGRSAYEVSNDENFGIVVFRADSESDAQEFMENDPSVGGNVMEATLHPFSLALFKSSL